MKRTLEFIIQDDETETAQTEVAEFDSTGMRFFAESISYRGFLITANNGIYAELLSNNGVLVYPFGDSFVGVSINDDTIDRNGFRFRYCGCVILSEFPVDFFMALVTPKFHCKMSCVEL